MTFSIKELHSQWLSKNLIYEVLKLPITVSKQFDKNKRIFNYDDVKIFKFYKQFWESKTVLEFWISQKIQNNKTVSKQFENSFENKKTDNNNVDDLIKKALAEEMQTVLKQFENKEVEFKNNILQKDKIIEIKNAQNTELAKIKNEEKREKEEWIKKYEHAQKQTGEWMNNFYSVKLYAILFWVLFLISILFIIFLLKDKF